MSARKNTGLILSAAFLKTIEPVHDKNLQNGMCARQISLGIHPVWSVFAVRSLVATDPSFLHANSEDSDQTGRMPRLIWVFAGRKCHFVGFAIRWRNSCFVFVSLLRCNLQRFISQVRMIPQRNLWFCAYFKATRQLSTWKQRLICYVHVFVQSCFHGSSMHTWCSCLSPSATMPTVYSNQVTSSKI